MPRVDATIHLGHLLQIGALALSMLGAIATVGAWQARVEEKLAAIGQRLDKVEQTDTSSARDWHRLAEEMARLQATLAATNSAVARLEKTLDRHPTYRSATP